MRPAVRGIRHPATPAAAIFLAAAVAACGGTVSETPEPTATAEPGTRITFDVAAADGSSATADLAEQVRATLEARARALDPGATVAIGGDGRLILESTGPLSPAAQRALLALGAVVVAPLPADRFGNLEAPGPQVVVAGDLLPSGLEPLLREGDIDPAGVALLPDTEGGPGVTLRLTPAGTAALAAWSADHVGDLLAIAVDNRVVSVPVLQAPIADGAMTISTPAGEGWPTTDDLAVLRGAFPAGVRIVESSIERVPAP
jgi:preprotein translocase subunit SecD